MTNESGRVEEWKSGEGLEGSGEERGNEEIQQRKERWLTGERKEEDERKKEERRMVGRDG